MAAFKELVWDKKYKVGIIEIDYQHKYFVELINRLIRNYKLLQKKDLIKIHLTELVYYTRFHFCSEENIMKLLDYPELKTHMALHREIVDEWNSYVYFAETSTENLIACIQFLSKWFFEHTMNEDKKIFDYRLKVDSNNLEDILHFQE